MFDKIKAKTTQTGVYIKDHAPEIVTAFAAIGIYLTTRTMLKEHRIEMLNEDMMNENDRKWINTLTQDEVPFTHYAGLGVFAKSEDLERYKN